MIKQEKLSKALLVVFIDRCTNLPVDSIKRECLCCIDLCSMFSDRKRRVSRIHSVESKSIRLNVKRKHLKVKLIHNLNTYHKFYVPIRYNKSYLLKCAMHDPTMILLACLNCQSNKYSTHSR
jgi:hypothetical protein